MSQLTDFRDHARAMAGSQHRPDCLVRDHPWTKPRPTKGCTGCMTGAERALWARLADEVDEPLPLLQAPDLFGNTSPEPGASP